MAKNKTAYVCEACGHRDLRWSGKCTGCGAWNTLVEKAVDDRPAPRPALSAADRPIRLADVPIESGGEVRVRTGLGELDGVLGGGLVSGSVVLLGGDPGVGKSTLLLIAADRFARRGIPVLYASGEESARQIRLRSDRLGVSGDVWLFANTDFGRVEAAARGEIDGMPRPRVVVIDSIQTLQIPDVDGLPGSIAQIREVAHRATVLAKTTGTAVLLVGHVTKSGDIAGPKLLEHLVDTVLYFEGDGRSSLRMLRSTKNRFGATGEVGVFEMVEEGLVEVPDASARLLAERVGDAAGTAVVAGLEGSRPLLVEVQALVGRPGAPVPARTCVGVDRGRLSMLAAVLDKAKIDLHDRDIYINVAGGVRLVEPATDLAICVAVASSLTQRAIRADIAVFGEVGLVGEVRGVGHPGLRLREAARHGFRRVVVPATTNVDAPPGVTLIPVRTVREAILAVGAGPEHR